MSGIHQNDGAAGRLAIGLWLGLCGAGFGGCDYQLPAQRVLTSLRLRLISPNESELGSPQRTVQPASVLAHVEALDNQGQSMPLNVRVQAFLAAGGERLPLSNPCSGGGPPMMMMTGGDPTWLLLSFPLAFGRAAAVTFPLTAPTVFGPVELNLEEPVSGAVGATSPIYFPNPTLPQRVKPIDLDARDATYCTPHLGRQVTLDSGTAPGPGQPAGKLVVSSLFTNGLAVTDTGASQYNSLYVFTFGQPSVLLHKGRVVQRLAGAIAKFNGMTQLINPKIRDTDQVRPELVPPPTRLDVTRLPKSPANSPQNKYLTKLIAAPVRVAGTACEVTADSRREGSWNKYSTLVINELNTNPRTTAAAAA